jgi:hypothetical protein
MTLTDIRCGCGGLHTPVPLTKGRVAIVAETDFPRVSEHSCHAARRLHVWYAATRIDGQIVYLHRFPLSGESPHIDHIDGDGLNNCRANLRPATRSQNRANSRAGFVNRWGYCGIRRCPLTGRWAAKAGRVHLGRFDSPEQAACAYDRKARELWGAYARLNFPDQGEVTRVYVPEPIPARPRRGRPPRRLQGAAA